MTTSVASMADSPEDSTRILALPSGLGSSLAKIRLKKNAWVTENQKDDQRRLTGTGTLVTVGSARGGAGECSERGSPRWMSGGE